MLTGTAVEELTRRFELAREALSVSDYVASAEPGTVRQATALDMQLKTEIADMESELRDLERPPTPDHVENLAQSHEQIKSYRPDTRAAATRHK